MLFGNNATVQRVPRVARVDRMARSSGEAGTDHQGGVSLFADGLTLNCPIAPCAEWYLTHVHGPAME